MLMIARPKAAPTPTGCPPCTLTVRTHTMPVPYMHILHIRTMYALGYMQILPTMLGTHMHCV